MLFRSNVALRGQIAAIRTQTVALESFNGAGGKLKETLDNLSETIGNKLGGAIGKFIKASAELIIIELIITTVVDAISRYQRAVDEINNTRNATQALKELTTTYKNVTDASSSATKAQRDFRQALVDTEYSRTITRIDEIRKSLNDLRYEGEFGIQTWEIGRAHV